jgi:hypothetical protein
LLASSCYVSIVDESSEAGVGDLLAVESCRLGQISAPMYGKILIIPASTLRRYDGET